MPGERVIVARVLVRLGPVQSSPVQSAYSPVRVHVRAGTSRVAELKREKSLGSCSPLLLSEPKSSPMDSADSIHAELPTDPAVDRPKPDPPELGAADPLLVDQQPQLVDSDAVRLTSVRRRSYDS